MFNLTDKAWAIRKKYAAAREAKERTIQRNLEKWRAEQQRRLHKRDKK